MKRIGAFFLAFILSALSIFIYYPSFSFAADDVTVIPRSSKENFSFSSSDALSYVQAHKDIYSNDNVRLFIYDPGESYNWTLGSASTNGIIIHLSDNQLKNILMTSNNFSENSIICQGLLSNSSFNRSLLIGLGCLAGSSSDTTKAIIDTIYGNYNYLDSLNYDEDSQTIIMSNDNGSVDKLREEIKNYYYDSIGLCQWPSSGTVKSFVDSSEYRKNFEFEEDYQNAYYINSKYCIASSYANYALFFDDKFDYMYLSNSEKKNLYYDGWYYDYYKLLYRDGTDFSSKLVGEDKKGLIIRYGVTPLTNVSDASLYYHNSYPKRMALCPSFIMNNNGTTTEDTYVQYYSYDNTPLMFFKSYSAYYNFINGDQNAYLSSKIEETGQDISFSIKDMNENLGTKMDELIDSINSGKASMSQDELQNAIDSGLEELNKNTEEIKDNTAEMNNKLDELIAAVNHGNDTLLEILGVTEYIAYSTTKDDGTAYTLDDLFFSFGSIYDALGNAILYGVNTLDADAASASYSSSAYSLSSAALLSDDDSGNSGSGGSVGNSGSGNSGSGGHIDFEYRNGLFGHFPFSVPYQLYEWLQVLKATPKCPEFTYNYGFLLGHKDEDAYSITFDLSAYQDWADNCKSFLRLSFTLLFAVGVFNKLKGVM